MSGELTIRPARPDDRPAIEHICAHTWPDGDYVPYLWDQWLADEQGPLIVGEFDGRVVALNKITFQTPDQAWLQGMRVDPDFRRRGIAGQFLEYSLAYAREHGARVARLDTSVRNTAVHIMVARAGMERMGDYVFWIADALAEGPHLSVLSAGDQAVVQAFLRDSPVLAHCRGVYEADWAWQELSAERVTHLLRDRRIVARLTSDGRLVALAIVTFDAEDRALEIGFADGEHFAVTELATAVRAFATQVGASQARAWIADLPWLRDAFDAAGFGFGDWQGEMLLFELRFDPVSGDGHAS